MRVKSLFYKKIVCESCGSNYKLKKERGVNRYVCSYYDNGKGCKRCVVEEEKFIKAINRRYRRELSENEIREVVVKIIIRSERLFDIHLTEGKPISYHERGIVF